MVHQPDAQGLLSVCAIQLYEGLSSISVPRQEAQVRYEPINKVRKMQVKTKVSTQRFQVLP